MEYNSWGMRVFDGLNKDIEQLMDNFVKTGSVRYEGFCQIWQEMNFSLVYWLVLFIFNMYYFLFINFWTGDASFYSSPYQAHCSIEIRN